MHYFCNKIEKISSDEAFARNPLASSGWGLFYPTLIHLNDQKLCEPLPPLDICGNCAVHTLGKFYFSRKLYFEPLYEIRYRDNGLGFKSGSPFLKMNPTPMISCRSCDWKVFSTTIIA